VPTVRLQFRHLPESCQPGWVVRHRGVTLVAIDPRTTNRTATEWIVTALTTDELNVVRTANGAPPVGEPCPDRWMEDCPVDTWVPMSLRLRQHLLRSA
jgi:hypothetical protein